MNAVAGLIQKGDYSLFRLFNRDMHCRMLDVVMRYITHLGSLTFALMLPLVMIAAGGQLRAAGLRIALILIASQAAVQLLKRLVHRPRPYRMLDCALPMDPPSCQYSFPSGHTSAAFALALTLAGFYPDLVPVLYGLAFMVGLSRVYLGVHYPTDCLAGFVVTWLTVIILR